MTHRKAEDGSREKDHKPRLDARKDFSSVLQSPGLIYVKAKAAPPLTTADSTATIQTSMTM